MNAVSYYAADAGFVVMEQAWAGQMNLGPIRLTGVPVSEANSAEIDQGSSGYKATLGLTALRRLDLIIDRRHGCAYVRPKTTAPRPYDHNRTGAAVEPKDSGEIVIARVVQGSPADQAGVRAGDVLLKIGGRDVSNWHGAPVFFESENAPAGTRLSLTLERNGTKLTTILVLRDLIGPSSGTTKPGRNRPSRSPGRTNDFSHFKVDVRLRPPDAGDYNRRAFIYEENDRLDVAISNYTRAIQLDATSHEAFCFRGRCFLKKGNFEQAIDDSKCAISLQPTNELAWLDLGYAYFEQSNWDGALTAYGEAIRLNPSNAQSHLYRGLAYEAKGAVKEAFDDYNEAIHLDPKDARASLVRGRRYYMSGEIDQAIRDFSTVITLNPTSAEAYQARGYAYSQHGELHLAISDLSEVIRLQPTNAWAYGTRGNTYFLKRDWEKAIHDYSEALRLNPKDVSVRASRGMASFNRGDLEQAHSDFLQAIALRPDDPLHYRNLAWFEATCAVSSLRNGPAAVEAGRRACELTNWKDAGALTTLAAASAEVGDFDNAVKYEKQALAIGGLGDQDRKAMGERLSLYQERKAYHQPARE